MNFFIRSLIKQIAKFKKNINKGSGITSLFKVFSARLFCDSGKNSESKERKTFHIFKISFFHKSNKILVKMKAFQLRCRKSCGNQFDAYCSRFFDRTHFKSKTRGSAKVAILTPPFYGIIPNSALRGRFHETVGNNRGGLDFIIIERKGSEIKAGYNFSIEKEENLRLDFLFFQLHLHILQ